jgi:hypothetical protein
MATDPDPQLQTKEEKKRSREEENKTKQTRQEEREKINKEKAEIRSDRMKQKWTQLKYIGSTQKPQNGNRGLLEKFYAPINKTTNKNQKGTQQSNNNTLQKSEQLQKEWEARQNIGEIAQTSNGTKRKISEIGKFGGIKTTDEETENYEIEDYYPTEECMEEWINEYGPPEEFMETKEGEREEDVEQEEGIDNEENMEGEESEEESIEEEENEEEELRKMRHYCEAVEWNLQGSWFAREEELGRLVNNNITATIMGNSTGLWAHQTRNLGSNTIMKNMPDAEGRGWKHHFSSKTAKEKDRIGTTNKKQKNKYKNAPGGVYLGIPPHMWNEGQNGNKIIPTPTHLQGYVASARIDMVPHPKFLVLMSIYVPPGDGKNEKIRKNIYSYITDLKTSIGEEGCIIAGADWNATLVDEGRSQEPSKGTRQQDEQHRKWAKRMGIRRNPEESSEMTYYSNTKDGRTARIDDIKKTEQV